VQSPALRLIVEREEEIERFEAREYWSVQARLAKASHRFPARLVEFGGEKIEQFSIVDAARAAEVRNQLLAGAQGQLQVERVERKQKRRNPTAPFITSTLQQEAARKLGFTAKRTMQIAQQLYEGVDLGGEQVGLISYMRTDSVALAQEAVQEIRAFIAERYGSDQLPAQPRTYKTRAKNAQEAHEAVRPTSVQRDPEALRRILTPDQAKLYELIWKRTVACQMTHATFDTVAITLTAGDAGRFRATGQTLVHPGFMAVYQEGRDEQSDEDENRELPAIAEGESIPLEEIEADQHFTDLCQYHLDLAGPGICGARSQALHAHRCRPHRQSLPDPTLHPVRGLPVHRPTGGPARRRLPRRAGMGAGAGGFLGPVQESRG
jgi:DNA topoisomerase-1